MKDLQVAQDIADTVDACPDLPILEVGPGMGVLTQFLIPKGRQLKVVELDFESVVYLRENFAQLGRQYHRKGFPENGFSRTVRRKTVRTDRELSL